LCLAGAGAGKALKNGTKVKTPLGDIAIEQLKIGDKVFASDGNSYPVVGVYPQGMKPTVRITFSDRNHIDCSEDHLWLYQTKSMRDQHKGFDVKTTKELLEIPLKKKSGEGFANNLYIPMCNPCVYPKQDVPIDPYFLGLLLGDGGLSSKGVKIHNIESDILAYIECVIAQYDCHLVKYADCTYSISKNKAGWCYKNNLLSIICDLGLNCLSIDKHIPNLYKYNGVETRLALLQGLIDTDGHVSKSIYELSTASERLALDIAEMAESLGLTCVVVARGSHYINDGQRVDLNHNNYRIFIKPSKEFAALHRSKKHSQQRLSGGTQTYARRYITDICYLGIESEMTCIAVDSPDHSFLTEHCIVTHNTTVMIERISRLVSKGVAPSSILALTFTNAAAAEMKERFENKNPGKETPEFRTFHSFCYSILCKDPNIRQALGYTEVPSIASDMQIKELEEKAKTQCNIKLSKEKLTHRENLTKQEQYQIELYDKAINRLMRSANVITFDKLNITVAELFASGNIATQCYKDKYKYIFNDEAQDDDRYQMLFLNSFANTNFYLCGDVLQNLYSFRGTSNEYIKALANTPGWEKIRLFTNYRSTNQICEYANKFSKKYADESYWIEMQGTRDGERVITKLVEGPANYSAIDLKDIQDVLNEINKLTGTSAILCRTNKEVYAVTGYLKNQGISYTSNKDNQLQKIVNCAISDDYALGLYASYLSSNKYGEYIRLSEQVKKPDLEWFLKNYGDNSQIKNIREKVDDLKLIASRYDPVAVKLSEVEKLFHLQSVKIPDKNLREIEFLRYLKDIVTDIKSSELYVGTIHSVKGLEYDNVFVMNVGSYNFRLNNEDMKNLFYVAITRAKNRLYVYKILV
jgi:superfamily I DNA/RNA helicase